MQLLGPGPHPELLKVVTRRADRFLSRALPVNSAAGSCPFKHFCCSGAYPGLLSSTMALESRTRCSCLKGHSSRCCSARCWCGRCRKWTGLKSRGAATAPNWATWLRCGQYTFLPTCGSRGRPAALVLPRPINWARKDNVPADWICRASDGRRFPAMMQLTWP